MGSVWSAADNGITLAVTGEQTPEEAMTDAAEQVRALIQGALVGMVNLPGSYQDLAGCGASGILPARRPPWRRVMMGSYILIVDIAYRRIGVQSRLGW